LREGIDRVVVVHPVLRSHADDPPQKREPPGIVTVGLGPKRGAAERLLLVERAEFAAHHPQAQARGASQRHARRVTRDRGTLGSRGQDFQGRATIEVVGRPYDLQLERQVESVRPQQLGGTREKRRGGPAVEPVLRAPACRGQTGGRALAQIRVEAAELGEVTVRLLEVVADDLVRLDERPAVLGEPIGEAGVQVGADRLWESVVGGIPDQQVPEA